MSFVLPALVVALIGVVIVQRLHFVNSLTESEAKMRTLVENAPEALVILDVEAGRFVEVNERAERLFLRTREELLTLGPDDVSPALLPNGEPSSELAMDYVQKAVEGATPSFEWWHQDAHGDLIPCGIRLVRLPARGRVLVRGSIVDISAQKSAEARQRVLEDQLRQSRKLEAVGQLTGGVAHDFNNILTVALGNLELMLDEDATDDAWRELALESISALQRAALLTSQLLAFSRRQPLAPELLDAGELIRGLTGMLRRTLGETIDLREEFDEDLWACSTDRGQLENAILNLALNARDAMPSGGPLQIEARNVHVTPERIEGWYDGASPGWDPPEVPSTRDFVCVVVTDRGQGMDPETRERAFEPFFTTKDVGKGSGLGLSMIYGFAKQSGGHVEIDSTVGAGTTVRIFLPKARPTPVKAAVDEDTEAPDAVARGSMGRVLVVEDDPGARAVAVAFLESLGYSVSAVENGLEALYHLGNEDPVDVLFTDVVLPGGVGGVELAGRAVEANPELRVVFCSGYGEDSVPDAESILELGPLVEKPYSRKDLASVL